MRFIKSLVLAGLAVLLLGSAAGVAQQAPTIQQSGSMLNASQFLQGQVGNAVCSTVASSTANGTVSITPPGGQYVYITGVYIDIVSDATGTTTTNTLSTTNLTGAPIWSLATIVPTANSVGQFRQIAESYSTPYKSRTPGTAVTFVPSGTAADTIYCIRVAGYFAP